MRWVLLVTLLMGCGDDAEIFRRGYRCRIELRHSAVHCCTAYADDNDFVLCTSGWFDAVRAEAEAEALGARQGN